MKEGVSEIVGAARRCDGGDGVIADDVAMIVESDDFEIVCAGRALERGDSAIVRGEVEHGAGDSGAQKNAVVVEVVSDGIEVSGAGVNDLVNVGGPKRGGSERDGKNDEGAKEDVRESALNEDEHKDGNCRIQ